MREIASFDAFRLQVIGFLPRESAFTTKARRISPVEFTLDAFSFGENCSFRLNWEVKKRPTEPRF